MNQSSPNSPQPPHLWAIAILNSSQHRQVITSASVIQLGNQPTTSQPDDEVIAVEDDQVADHHCTIRITNSRSAVPEITITNHGRTIVFGHGPRLHQHQSMQLSLPFMFCVGDTQAQVFAPHSPDGPDHAPGARLDQQKRSIGSETCHASKQVFEELSPGPGTLASWLDALGDLHRSVAGSHQFFAQAARAVFNPGGLDGGMVLLPNGDGWDIAASYMPYPGHGIGYRPDVIDQAVAARTTVYDNASAAQAFGAGNLHNAVATPVLDSNDSVIAVVYGFRSRHRTNSRHGIRALEAHFVQVVSDSIAAGMTRLETESAAAQSRALLDQAFSPKVARQLENDPSILAGQTREVSVLFADLRGFSTISERIGPKHTYELLTDVMDCLSQLVAAQDGVVIDFFGDGLAAFWNAPLDQPDHAAMACGCGMAMLEAMPALNDKWESRLQSRLKIGIGIHTGMAQVGNAGSRTRLKYGPQGNTVNLASRLEGVTRYVGTPLVVSQATAMLVSDSFQTRRICRTQMDGMQHQIDIFELLVAETTMVRDDELQQYVAALAAFESGDLSRAIAMLAELQIKNESDSVVQFLLTQALANQEGVSAALGKTRMPPEKFAPIAMAKSVQSQGVKTLT